MADLIPMDPALRRHCEDRHDLVPEPTLIHDQPGLLAWHRKDHTVIKSHDESDWRTT